MNADFSLLGIKPNPPRLPEAVNAVLPQQPQWPIAEKKLTLAELCYPNGFPELRPYAHTTEPFKDRLQNNPAIAAAFKEHAEYVGKHVHELYNSNLETSSRKIWDAKIWTAALPVEMYDFKDEDTADICYELLMKTGMWDRLIDIKPVNETGRNKILQFVLQATKDMNLLLAEYQSPEMTRSYR